MHPKLKNILIRATSGAVFISILLFCAYYGGYYNYALYFIFGAIGAFEFHKIIERKYGKTSLLWIFLTLIFIVLRWNDYGAWFRFKANDLLPVLLVIVCIVELLAAKKSGVEKMSLKMLGLLYVGFGFSSIPVLGLFENTYYWSILVIFFFTLWANDTFAYLTGMFFGKTPLFKRVSPNKTWEGTFGGALMAILFTLVLSEFFFDTPISRGDWIVLALITIIFGALGDLLESLIKRWADVKDSGKIMPGHGGVLDRLDSAIFAAPAFIFYLLFFAK